MDKDPFQGRLDDQRDEHYASYRAKMQEPETPGLITHIETSVYRCSPGFFETKCPKTGIHLLLRASLYSLASELEFPIDLALNSSLQTQERLTSEYKTSPEMVNAIGTEQCMSSLCG